MPMPTSRGLLRVAAAGQTAFAVTFLAEDATRRGFQPWRRWVSHLSLGPWGWVNSVGLAIGGASALAGAAGLTRVRLAGRGRFLPAPVAVYGAGLVLAAAFPIDPGLGWPPGQPARHTAAGRVHDLAGGLTFAGLAGAAGVGQRWFAQNPPRLRWRRWSTVTGVTVPASFAACCALVSLDYSKAWPGAPSGLFERIALLTGMGWLISVFVHLDRTPGAASDSRLIRDSHAVAYQSNTDLY